jgi:hypothetical protein
MKTLVARLQQASSENGLVVAGKINFVAACCTFCCRPLSATKSQPQAAPIAQTRIESPFRAFHSGFRHTTPFKGLGWGWEACF